MSYDGPVCDCQKSKSYFTIEKLTERDYCTTMELMKQYFFKEETTTATLGANIPEADLLKAFKQDYTLVARCPKDNSIVGGVVAEIENFRSPLYKLRHAERETDNKLRQMRVLFSLMQQYVDFWEKYKVEKVYEISYVFVRTDHRRRGIARKLMEECKKMGKKSGYHVHRCDATCTATAKICEKLNMILLAEVPFNIFRDEHGNTIINPHPPDDILKIFASED